MRPVGSTNGRKPPGGYPELSDYVGGLLAGFIEGEACFAITKQTRGFGYRPMMSIAVRDDDTALLEELTERTKLGRTTRKPAYRTSRPQAGWQVSAKADCQRLVQILDRHILRGHKAPQYLIWRDAVAAWIGDDITGRRKPDEWGPFAHWKRGLESAKRYVPSAITHGTPAIAPGWEPYLAGFITAEGHFAVEEPGRARLTIHLRADDAPLLRQLRDACGLGRVSGPHKPGGLAKHPTVAWITGSNADTLAMVELLECFPPAGRKRLEFEIWKQAVLERAVGHAWGRERVALIRQMLMELRTYAPATP